LILCLFLFLTSNLSHLFSELFLLFLFASTRSLSCLHTHFVVCCVEHTHTYRILECHEFLREQMKER
jgi:hypothetical protein